MPRPKQSEHRTTETNDEEFVPYHDDESFVPRESVVVAANTAPVRSGKGKRSVEDMMLSMPNAAFQATYAMKRIAVLEDQIANILELCSKEALAIVLGSRASLKMYAPDE